MKKQQKITVRSYVRNQNGELVEFKELPPEVRERVAMELKLRFLNTLFAGKATFFPADDQIAAQKGGVETL